MTLILKTVISIALLCSNCFGADFLMFRNGDDLKLKDQLPNGGEHWALIVAGSNGWFNYRHQADACHAYQILKSHGLPDERIVVMMYDDLAENQENPTPGIVINHPNGSDVYHGVPKDYTGETVTPENFLKVLAGDLDGMKGIGSGKVIQSGPNDHVFVNFVDHGAPGLIAFPNGELYASQLIKVLKSMYSENKFAQMVIYVEACESGSMFENLLPSNINIYATTAANSEESSYACYFDKARQTFLGDVYSVKWMEDSDKENLSTETLARQFRLVKEETNTSHVQEFGDMQIANEAVGFFQGLTNTQKKIVPNVPLDAVKSEDVKIEILKRRLVATKNTLEILKLTEEIRDEAMRRRNVEVKMRDIVSITTGRNGGYGKTRFPLTKWECYEPAAKFFDATCFDLSKNDYAMRHLFNLVNVCEENVPLEKIIKAIRLFCKKYLIALTLPNLGLQKRLSNSSLVYIRNTYEISLLDGYGFYASESSRLTAAKRFINFINNSPSPYHGKKVAITAVHESASMLEAAGFKELKESEKWDIKPLDKYYMTKNKSTLIAFAVGGNYKPGNGFSIIGAHTDSPCLRVKPVSKKVKSGFVQVGVECYGGGTWHTWFDRDLTIAGRVLVKNNDNIVQKLIHVKRPILRVPNLAIHLNREMGTKLPVLATSIEEELQKGVKSSGAESSGQLSAQEKHQPLLIELICKELGIRPEQIVDFELCLADTQPAAIGGILEEFIFSPRLDNLHSSYCAIQGLINSLGHDSLKSDSRIRMVSLFDNEEVGSQSAQGAMSTIQELILRRLSSGANPVAFEESISKSLMISSDMAHAVHPNYPDKHEDQHKPSLHKGIVIKTNQNQRYATTLVTAGILREIAQIAQVPLQDFVVRNDSLCGSTIGPIMSAKLGMATIDIGAPQLSMHSIREMCDVSSIKQGCDLFKTFYENFGKVYEKFQIA
ncbi:DgyrCDS4956 [Dimorphilus gyrociliatus]|uniref:Aspartyl aminopeptidase n=1 Tax=Dimorphilus gyrociliatus TaxID=2664684 RepID=A0A7I8VJ11_9ANNE|nr:DgyrCDS4956 [Dimorphilus gyrociliatus]